MSKNNDELKVVNDEIAFKYLDSLSTNIQFDVNKVDKLPIFDSAMSNLISVASISDKEKSHELLTIILLKLYLSHLKCCNQSYDLCDGIKFVDPISSPILFYYTRQVKLSVSCNECPSSIAFDVLSTDTSKILSSRVTQLIDEINFKLLEINNQAI